MSYNGWSNRATWNVSLWLNNDEGSYRELAGLVRRASDVHDLARDIEDLCRAIWTDGKTPDGDSLDEADFEEIASGEWEDGREGEDPETGEPFPFVDKHGIKFECHRVPARPDGMMSDGHITHHFRCRIKCGNKSFGLYFSQGSAEPPTVAEVLNCLASDASSYENASTFEDWASEFGFDTDSRKAEKSYRAVKRQAKQLKRVIGDEAYNELLWEVERL